MWIDVGTEKPTWMDDKTTDRELAANICAGCPVADECLELEFRTAGFTTLGVWGALAENDRRATYLAWLQRREGVGDERQSHPDAEGVMPEQWAPLETEPVSVHARSSSTRMTSTGMSPLGSVGRRCWRLWAAWCWAPTTNGS